MRVASDTSLKGDAERAERGQNQNTVSKQVKLVSHQAEMSTAKALYANAKSIVVTLETSLKNEAGKEGW